MPRRYWNIGVALVLTLVVGLSQAQPVSDNGSQPTQHKESADEPQGRAEPVDWATAQNLIERIARALESSNRQEKPDWEREYTKRDLDAQEEMAAWANDMFGVGILGIFLTGVGIFLIWRTLKYTAEAADYARRAALAGERAVKESASATEAAFRAVEVTEKMGRVQTRAYMNYETTLAVPVGLNSDPTKRAGFNFMLNFKNFGNSPAYEAVVMSKGGAVVRPQHISPPDQPTAPHPEGFLGFQIGPGSLFSGNPFYFSIDDIFRAQDGKTTLYLSARMDYKDAFGVKRFSEVTIGIVPLATRERLLASPINTGTAFQYRILGPHNRAN